VGEGVGFFVLSSLELELDDDDELELLPLALLNLLNDPQLVSHKQYISMARSNSSLSKGQPMSLQIPGTVQSLIKLSVPGHNGSSSTSLLLLIAVRYLFNSTSSPQLPFTKTRQRSSNP